ncbi:hypothetical protein ZWY2020_014388 [Hordeum vulgare]|nr:hypothetical protein ZWY2020_014388 [Hordeum vulgare]
MFFSLSISRRLSGGLELLARLRALRPAGVAVNSSALSPRLRSELPGAVALVSTADSAAADQDMMAAV